MKSTNKKKSDLLLIVPAYNEQECIEPVIRNLEENYPQYDYVIINDGSADSTSAIAHRCGFNIVDLPINLGLTGAFQTGLRYAREHGYRYAVQFDADGQHKPDFIDALTEQIEKGSDIAIASRFVTEKKPFTSRMIGSRLIEWAIWMTTGKKIKDPTSGMRIYSEKIIQNFDRDVNLTPEPDTIAYLLKSGYRVDEVQAQMEERMAGESYLKPAKAARYMIVMLTSILLIQPFRRRKK